MSAAPAELETAWTVGGYHGFSLDRGTGPRSAAPGTCWPGYPDELEREIPSHWHAMQ